MSRKTRLNGNGADHPVSSGSVLAFTIPSRDARGRVVRLGPELTAILAAHDYPAPLCHVLAEALTLTVVIGSILQKGGGQTTVQTQSSGGVVDLLVCDYRAGEIRGYLRFDESRAQALAVGVSLTEVFGTGYLAITIDQSASAERYQGIVPLEGDTLAQAVEQYFSGSEQVPTLVRAVARREGGGWYAGGLLVQYLPHGETGGQRLTTRESVAEDWAHVAALAGTVAPQELADPGISNETLLWRLFNEDEVRVMPPVSLSRGCRCTVQHFKDVLSKFPAGDIESMRGDNGLIEVNCEFCARVFPIEINDEF